MQELTEQWNKSVVCPLQQEMKLQSIENTLLVYCRPVLLVTIIVLAMQLLQYHEE